MITGPGGCVGCFMCMTEGVREGNRMIYPATPPFTPRLGAIYNYPQLITRLLGFTGVPNLVQLQQIQFDPIIDFPHDVMHMVALGFWKASLAVMFGDGVWESLVSVSLILFVGYQWS